MVSVLKIKYGGSPRGDDEGQWFFSSEMCCELFSDSSQQEVVCPLYTEVFVNQQPDCHLPNIILPYVHFSSHPTHQSDGLFYCSMCFPTWWCILPSGHVLLLTPWTFCRVLILLLLKLLTTPPHPGSSNHSPWMRHLLLGASAVCTCCAVMA